jgi:hypothetical protein
MLNVVDERKTSRGNSRKINFTGSESVVKVGLAISRCPSYSDCCGDAESNGGSDVQIVMGCNGPETGTQVNRVSPFSITSFEWISRSTNERILTEK